MEKSTRSSGRRPGPQKRHAIRPVEKNRKVAQRSTNQKKKSESEVSHFVPANSRTLQLDIDSGKDLSKFWEILRMFSAIADSREIAIGLRGVLVLASKTPNHWHIEIKTKKPLTIMERICLQAILRSDAKRELSNWERAKLRAPHPILFFRESGSASVSMPKNMVSTLQQLGMNTSSIKGGLQAKPRR